MITIIGLGAGDPDALSRGAERALREASAKYKEGNGLLLLRTRIHPIVSWLEETGVVFESCDDLYECADSFDQLYPRIAERVLEAARKRLPDGDPFPVIFAVPGHPLFAESSVELILNRARAEGIETRVLSSGSFVEAVFAAASISLGDGCDIRDALTLLPSDSIDPVGRPLSRPIDPSHGLLLCQVYDTSAASHAKLCLMRDYPDDWNVTIIRAAGVPGEQQVLETPLHRLDHHHFDHLTSVYIPPLPPEARRPDFGTLAGLMARLRAPDGCPWDREQTSKSLKKYFIEETYEVIGAIDEGDPDHLCEELGDALLQVVFHAQLAAEEGDFSLDDVVVGIVTKLVRRHPHVFGEVNVADSAEVLRNWDQIKRIERQNTPPASILDRVTPSLPTLMRALEISKAVVKVGFEWPDFPAVMAKLDEELGELRAELAADTPNQERIASELGDLFFTLVQVARWNKIDPEIALMDMLSRFTRRFQYIEKRAAQQERELGSLSAEELDTLWEDAKRTLADSETLGS